jgi:hypothetical protein
MLDPLEPVLRRLIEKWPEIKSPRVTEILRDDYGYTGSVDLVRRRLAVLRPRSERAAQKTGYRPGQVLRSIGPRCRPGPGSLGARDASTR